MEKSKPGWSKRLKVELSLAAVAAAVIYSGYTLRRYRRGLPPEARRTEAPQAVAPAGVPSASDPYSPVLGGIKPLPLEDFEGSRRGWVDHLDLTIQQQLQLRKVWTGEPPRDPVELGRRLKATREVLTPAQQEILRETLDDRIPRRIAERQDVAQRVLPSDQYKIFNERLQRRAAEFQEAVNALDLSEEMSQE